MKISYNWLKQYLPIDIKSEKIAEILTNIGLEVESVETFEEIKGGLKGLVIGEVLTCTKHPNADKLSLTTVNIGDDTPLAVVCGAPNVAAGQKVIVATVGTTLYSGQESFTIKKSKIRGELSEGMLCAEDEIGMGASHEGIMVLPVNVLPGTPAAEYFGINSDTIFEIGLTPNRIDAASHFGVARDLAAFLKQEREIELLKPSVSELKVVGPALNIAVSIEDVEGCRRFTGLTISGVNVKPSPTWLQTRLKSIGLSPINNIVDISNFVLHECGQPLHAYDANKIEGNQIAVKKVSAGTKFITLDGVERTLNANDIMVCDTKKPLCIGGVFGGSESGITESTKNIFLESAYFDPISVRKTSRRLGIFTDSSFRFERGVDPQNTLIALKRAAALIVEIANGKISSEPVDVYPTPIYPVGITLLYSHIDRLIGKSIDHAIIRSILESLDIKIVSEDSDGLKVQVPPYRVDVIREADVIEEILRIYGYNNIDFSEKVHASVSHIAKPDNETMVNEVSELLSNNGFNEIMSNSLTRAAYYSQLSSFPEHSLVNLLNPLSADLNALRQTLLFGGLEAISRNTNYKNPNLRLYEFGRAYSLTGTNTASQANFREKSIFALFMTGNFENQSWAVKETASSFFQLKGYVLNILRKAGLTIESLTTKAIALNDELFSGGIEYYYGSTRLLIAGEINTQLLSRFDIENPVCYAELYWDEIFKINKGAKKFNELPKFPEVRRDLALLLDDSVEYQQIEQLAFEAESKLLQRVNLFDNYKGKNIPEGKKSYGISFFLQDRDKTLTDNEIDRVMQKITQNLVNQLKAELRQ